jgi:Xaa-Pro aminopeptidase
MGNFSILILKVFANEMQKEGLDYRHGTGHGVGSYLNVHEGPIGIGTRIQFSEVPLAPGNVISNEPGYYEDGSFGIRIENVIMVKEVETAHKFGDKPVSKAQASCTRAADNLSFE